MTQEKALVLAEAYVRMRRGERALQALKDALPDDDRTWLWRANALHVLGRYEEAAAAARTGLAIHAANAYLHSALGRAEFALLHFGEAENALRESLRLAPHEAETHSMMAALLIATKRRAEANRMSREALALASESPRVRGMDVFVKVMTGGWEAADRRSKELLADAPDDPIVHYVRGLARANIGDARGAARLYREAARLAPDVPLFVKAARVSNHWLLWPVRLLGPVPAHLTTLVLFVALCAQPGHWHYVWYALALLVYVWTAVVVMNLLATR